MDNSGFLRVNSVAEWRDWLKSHHATDRVIWLVFPKGRSPSVSYGDALDEALCWGWIDSLIKRINDQEYARKFTPRTNAAKWSKANLDRMRKLMKAGRVQSAGLDRFAPGIPKPGLATEKRQSRQRGSSPELQTALAAHKQARQFFEGLAPSYRRNYLSWVSSAKQPGTRERRAREAARLLAKGVKTLLK